MFRTRERKHLAYLRLYGCLIFSRQFRKGAHFKR